VSTESLDIEDHAALAEYLRRRPEVGASVPMEMKTLAGGVSNVVLRVDVAGRDPVVIKQCRERLRVAMEWRARLDRIWAEQAPFELRNILKARGYRWNDGTNGKPRSWWIDVANDQRNAELQFLEREIYQAEIDLSPIRITVFDRFSDRA